MRIVYRLEDTGISRAARVAMAQADALIARGHQVRIVTKGEPVTWRGSEAEWIYVDDFRDYIPDADERVAEASLLAHWIVDDDVYRESTPAEHEPPRVLLGDAEGYGAVAHARWFHQKLDLVRVSPFAPSREEPLDTVQEFHVALTTLEMTRLLHSCDLLVAPTPSLLEAEAMAAGLVCVRPPRAGASDVDLGEHLIEVLSDDALRERLREEGRETAKQWRAARVAEGLEALLR
jgi:hypothetical protein